MSKRDDSAEPSIAVRHGTARSRTGKATARKILDAARELLMQQGYTQFSMRNVAEQAGLHLGNVQYYFPRRDDLVAALLVDTGDRYQAAYEKVLADAPPDPVERFKIVLAYNLQDIATKETRQFFIQFWALLNALDGYSGRLLDDLYAVDIEQLSERIADMHPDIAPDEIKRRATLLAGFIEGLMVVRGSRGRRSPEVTRLMEQAAKLGLAIANGVAMAQ